VVHGGEGDVGIDTFHYEDGSVKSSISIFRSAELHVKHTYNGVFELARFVQIEEPAGAQRKLHAFVVLLQLVVDFRGQQRGKLPF
jgi:hypothetical protein